MDPLISIMLWVNATRPLICVQLSLSQPWQYRRWSSKPWRLQNHPPVQTSFRLSPVLWFCMPFLVKIWISVRKFLWAFVMGPSLVWTLDLLSGPFIQQGEVGLLFRWVRPFDWSGNALQRLGPSLVAWFD